VRKGKRKKWKDVGKEQEEDMSSSSSSSSSSKKERAGGRVIITFSLPPFLHYLLPTTKFMPD